jgi:hypothetical protein
MLRGGGVNKLTSIFPENSSQRLKLVRTSGAVSELPGGSRTSGTGAELPTQQSELKRN